MRKSVAVEQKKILSTTPAAVHKRKYDYSCRTLRFSSPEHHELVKAAAAAAGIAVNSWLIRVTLAAARRELKS